MSALKQTSELASGQGQQRSIASEIANKTAISRGTSLVGNIQNGPIQQRSIIQRKPGEDEELPLQRMPISNQNNTLQAFHPIQRKDNNTGMPDNLKNGLERMSGFDLNDVKVHYNSSKPAQLKAFAYTQGNDIHVGPGQEKHLPHEGWHVVQQRQGRVKPTVQMKGGVGVNNDPGLEHEADVMGSKSIDSSKKPGLSNNDVNSGSEEKNTAIQLKESEDGKDNKILKSSSNKDRAITVCKLANDQISFLREGYNDFKKIYDDQKFVGTLSGVVKFRLPSSELNKINTYLTTSDNIVKGIYQYLVSSADDQILLPQILDELHFAYENLEKADEKIKAYKDNSIEGAERMIKILEGLKELGSKATQYTVVYFTKNKKLGEAAGTAYTALTTILEQQSEKEYGLRKSIDWRGIAFDTAFDLFKTNFLDKKFDKIIESAVINNPKLKKLGTDQLKKLISDFIIKEKGIEVIKNITRYAFDTITKSPEKKSIEQVAEEFMEKIADPKSIFVHLFNEFVDSKIEKLLLKKKE
jgi:hypothetical protein